MPCQQHPAGLWAFTKHVAHTHQYGLHPMPMVTAATHVSGASVFLKGVVELSVC